MTLERRFQEIRNAIYLWRYYPNRIGDERRTEAADHLSDAHVAGFITKQEWEERTEIVFRSKYEHELDWALDDLPSRIKRPESPRQEIVLPVKTDYTFFWIMGISLAICLLIIILSLIVQ